VIWIAACGAAIVTGPRAAGTSVMVDLVRERFPLLVSLVLISLPLGLAAGWIRRPARNGGGGRARRYAQILGEDDRSIEANKVGFALSDRRPAAA
jgi:hypothetical protein